MIAKRISPLLLLAAAPVWAQSSAGPEVDLSGLLMSLAAVVALIVGGAYLLKRTPLGYAARGGNGPLKVVATLPIGPKERLLLVDVQGVEMLVAIAPGAVAVVPAGSRGTHPPEGFASDADRAEQLEQSFTLGDAR